MVDVDQKLRTHLSKHGLNEQRWLRAFKRLEIFDPESIDNKESKYEALQITATASEATALRKALGILNPAMESVDGVLEDIGLDVAYWMKVFEKQFGVISAEGIENLCSWFYPHLVQFARSQKEVSDLQSLLKMKDEKIELHEHYIKYLNLWKERVQQLCHKIETLEEYHSKGKPFNDYEVMNFCKSLMEGLQVPKEFWFSENTYDSFLIAIKAIFDDLITEVSGIKCIVDDDSAVFQKASNSLALKGVLKIGNNETRAENIIISVPEGVQFQLPIDSQHIKSVQCVGKEEEEAVLENTLFTKQSCRQNEEADYISTVKVFVVPVASCCFRPTQLSLSNDAINELQTIEKCGEVMNKCELFLKNYGSHVSLGPYHFGGSYKWRCYSCNIKPVDISDAKSLQSEVIQAYGCMSNLPVYPEVGKIACVHTSTDLRERTYIETITVGGVRPPTPVAVWKNKLMVDKYSWAILDSGTDYVSVWDIVVMSHQIDFKNPVLLADNLRTAWEKLNSVMLKIEVLPGTSDHAEHICKEVRDWIKENDFNRCISHLSRLLEMKELVMKEQMDVRQWAQRYLSFCPLQEYLQLTVDMCIAKQPHECEEIKCLMQRVVDPVDLESVPEFPKRDSIRQWLFGCDKQFLQIRETHLLGSIEQSLKVAQDLIPANVSSEVIFECLCDPVFSLKATTVFANTLNHLQRHLQMKGQLYDELFIATILLPFQYYTMQNMIYLRGLSDINILYDLFKKYSKTFLDTKSQGSVVKLQAYLVTMAIEISDYIDLGAHSRMCSHLTVLLDVMGKSMNSRLSNIIRTVMTGGKSTELEKMKLKHALELATTEHATSEAESVITRPVGPLKPKNSRMNFEVMLKLFDLQKCYPQKITLLQALEVSKCLLSDSDKCNNRKSYPYTIIQKILSFDHRCFIKLSKGAFKNLEWMNQSLQVVDFVATAGEKLVPNLSPLDGLIMVLLCADNILRQDLFCRLATCQIAIPLVLPDPIQQNLTLTVWSMRTIVKQWCSTSIKSHGHEVSILSYPSRAVSFLRFGAHHKSKSRLVNAVMNDSNHNTFYHYDCNGGSTPKLLTEGMIDIAWHLPSANSAFNNVVTFLNLHGDARNCQKQIQFLCKVSIMHFVLLNLNELDEKGSEILHALSQAPGGVVLLHKGRVPRGHKIKGIDVKVTVELDRKNEAETTACIRDIIKRCISQHRKTVQHHIYEDAAHDIGIEVDEDEKTCAEGKRLANEFKQVLDQVERSGTNPKDLLELQGLKYWHKYAIKQKEIYRQKEGKRELVQRYTEQLHVEIARIRKEQDQCVMKVNDNKLLNLFLNTIHKLRTKEAVRRYYLQWVKLFLDDLSREKLPPLHRLFQQKRAELQKAKDIERCKREVEQLNMELINASFGLEHLLREVGQVYEATTFCASKDYTHLAETVAELLIEGHPFELMDGDASHVPIKWVSAVLKQVKSKLNDPHIFVISILGVQSSGKSTLLNTLFGVNFSVSAGRCTRGAFMQLLPFHQSFMKDTYLLIVDTEGLRAPELDATQTHNHDNQLGTFVIGLAQVTIINVNGEVLADMNDVLQTAVHAFLRMKHVTKLKQGCHFVHHNVAEVMAVEKGMMGRAKIWMR